MLKNNEQYIGKKWFHGTSSKLVQLIMENGFKLNDEEYGMWGRGIYLTDTHNDAKKYGRETLQVEIMSEDVFFIDYMDIQKIIPDLLVEEEAGDPDFQEYIIQTMHKKAVAIKYPDDVVHLVVYDLNIIKKVETYESKETYIQDEEHYFVD